MPEPGVVEVVPKTTISEPKLYEGSGMFASMKQYLDPPKDDKKEEKIIDKKDENLTPPPSGEELGLKLEELEKPALIEEIRKNQKFVTERDTLIKERDTKLAELQQRIESGEDPELLRVLKDLSVDFAGTYNKIRDKYKLPDPNLVISQLSGNDINSRLKQWQDSHLKAYIQKKHGLAEGEFEYDPKEASMANTASYDWDDMTNSKKAELLKEISDREELENKRLTTLEEQQKLDKKWFADTYYGGNEEEVKSIVEKMNETIAKVTKGELTPDNHPFAMRNLIRGFHFDTLLNKAVEENTKEIVAQFAKFKMYLPDKTNPTDLTKVKSNVKPDDVESFSKEAMSKSPMLRTMNQMLQ